MFTVNNSWIVHDPWVRPWNLCLYFPNLTFLQCHINCLFCSINLLYHSLSSRGTYCYKTNYNYQGTLVLLRLFKDRRIPTLCYVLSTQKPLRPHSFGKTRQSVCKYMSCIYTYRVLWILLFDIITKCLNDMKNSDEISYEKDEYFFMFNLHFVRVRQGRPP